MCVVFCRQRQGLRQLVLQMAHPKLMGGVPVKGAQLADVLVRLVGALKCVQAPWLFLVPSLFPCVLRMLALYLSCSCSIYP